MHCALQVLDTAMCGAPYRTAARLDSVGRVLYHSFITVVSKPRLQLLQSTNVRHGPLVARITAELVAIRGGEVVQDSWATRACKHRQ